MHRRDFLKKLGLAAGAASAAGAGQRLAAAAAAAAAGPAAVLAGRPVEPFTISLAQWSLHRTLRAGNLEHLDFPRHAKAEFGIDVVEYVDQFWKAPPGDAAYLAELRRRCEGEGVRSGLSMVDTAGDLGAADRARRAEAVEKHRAWLEAAKALGCRALRVNARGEGSADELRGRIVESCGKLAEAAAALDLNLVIENHGGPSSDPDWLAAVMREVRSPWFGTLPDFGNFADAVDRYLAVEKLMPFAKAVSAKATRFGADGAVADTDFPRMMHLVLDAGYRGDVGIESSPPRAEDEAQAIRWTKASLEKVRLAQPAFTSLFNGHDLAGWAPVAGGEWTVEDGAIVGQNGKDWSTDPARTGSWLRTEREYGDFELALEYTVSPRGNSGIFFRSALERNPAFTGYELQIYDAPGAKPSRGGPSSLYDVVAPAKNRVRPAGEWNELRIIARGQRLRAHVNGEMVIDHLGDRALRGYLGLQNHDERTTVRFRNIYLAEG